MSEVKSIKDTAPRIRHGFNRFLGRTGLSYENKRKYDIYTNLYPDALRGDTRPGNYERRLDVAEDLATRSLGRKAVGLVVEWWKSGSRPNITTGDTDLILDEGEFMEMISDPDSKTGKDLEQIAASPNPITELRLKFQHLS